MAGSGMGIAQQTQMSAPRLVAILLSFEGPGRRRIVDRRHGGAHRGRRRHRRRPQRPDGPDAPHRRRREELRPRGPGLRRKDREKRSHAQSTVPWRSRDQGSRSKSCARRPATSGRARQVAARSRAASALSPAILRAASITCSRSASGAQCRLAAISPDAEALTPDEQAIANIRAWIAERWDVTIKSVDTGVDGFDRKLNNREAVAWYDDTAIYLPVQRIREASGETLKAQQIVKALTDRDLLADRQDKRRATVRWIPKIGRIDAYALKRREFGRSFIWAGAEEDEA
jgi:hypothetical protein